MYVCQQLALLLDTSATLLDLFQPCLERGSSVSEVEQRQRAETADRQGHHNMMQLYCQQQSCLQQLVEHKHPEPSLCQSW